MLTVLAFLVAGLIAGVLGGLFGIGGGLILVPVFVTLLGPLGVAPEQVLPFALGTSMAAIVFSASSSAWAHYRKGAVDLAVAYRILGALLVGAVIGATAASHAPRQLLIVFLALFQAVVGIYMLRKAVQESEVGVSGAAKLPHRGIAGLIGMVCSLTGIGGGTMAVPYFRSLNLPAKTAVGTSSVLGIPIALAGTASFVVNGLVLDTNSVPLSLGFIHLAALIGVVPGVVVGAQLGAKVAHALPPHRLMQAFGLFMLMMALKSGYSSISF